MNWTSWTPELPPSMNPAKDLICLTWIVEVVFCLPVGYNQRLQRWPVDQSMHLSDSSSCGPWNFLFWFLIGSRPLIFTCIRISISMSNTYLFRNCGLASLSSDQSSSQFSFCLHSHAKPCWKPQSLTQGLSLSLWTWFCMYTAHVWCQSTLVVEVPNEHRCRNAIKMDESFVHYWISFL